MIPLQLVVTSYDKSNNVCLARLQNGNIITIDPFVLCAIKMSDDEYKHGAGERLVGKSFLMIDYYVSPSCVIPCENGFIEINQPVSARDAYVNDYNISVSARASDCLYSSESAESASINSKGQKS